MKHIAAVAVVLTSGGAVALAACGSSDDEKAAKVCPNDAATDSAYSGSFVGPVRMDDDKHVIQVTRNGRPVSRARVCIDTKMVGMTSMRYTVKGKEVAPGRYQVGFKFEDEGTYKGNVVTQRGGKQVSIPVTVKVPSGAQSDDDIKSHDQKPGTRSSGGG